MQSISLAFADGLLHVCILFRLFVQVLQLAEGIMAWVPDLFISQRVCMPQTLPLPET